MAEWLGRGLQNPACFYSGSKRKGRLREAVKLEDKGVLVVRKHSTPVKEALRGLLKKLRQDIILMALWPSG